MDITTTVSEDATVITVVGSIDATTVVEFEEAWKKVLTVGAPKIIIDFKEVDYISSAGLRGVLIIAKTCKAQNIALAFVGLKAMVADIFKLSGFFTILKTFPDVETAKAQL